MTQAFGYWRNRGPQQEVLAGFTYKSLTNVLQAAEKKYELLDVEREVDDACGGDQPRPGDPGVVSMMCSGSSKLAVVVSEERIYGMVRSQQPNGWPVLCHTFFFRRGGVCQAPAPQVRITGFRTQFLASIRDNVHVMIRRVIIRQTPTCNIGTVPVFCCSRSSSI